jgi:hypothetical protein
MKQQCRNSGRAIQTCKFLWISAVSKGEHHDRNKKKRGQLPRKIFRECTQAATSSCAACTNICSWCNDEQCTPFNKSATRNCPLAEQTINRCYISVHETGTSLPLSVQTKSASLPDFSSICTGRLYYYYYYYYYYYLLTYLGWVSTRWQ